MKQLWEQLGTARGFVAFGFFVAASIFALTAFGIDVAPTTGPLAVIVGGVYGSGLIKLVTDRAKLGK